MKFVRYGLFALVGLVILLAAAVVIAVMVIDPNQYRGHIERAVADNTNLELELAGDLSWSLFPLGIEINDARTRLEDEDFASVEQLIARVDLFSLIRMSPSVHTFVLDGLDAHLIMDEDGQGNWERIMPETEATDEAAEDDAVVLTDDEGGAPLAFNVTEVRISDARVRYEDRQTGQDVTLNDFTLTASNIALGQQFPLSLAFKLALTEPELNVSGRLSMQIDASEDLQRFAITDLDSNFEMTGEPLGGETINARLMGDVSADLEAETASLSNLNAFLENVRVTTNLDIEGFGENPQIAGRLDVHAFSPRSLLTRMGQDYIDTSDTAVLEKFSLGTDIATDNGSFHLSDLLLVLDDTEFRGHFSYALEDGAIDLDLQGNKFNLDRYLPPSDDDEAAAEDETADAGDRDAELLPLEALRELIFNVRIGLDELIASNLTVTDIELKTTGRDGRMALEHLRGQLYEGTFNLSAELDARTDDPRWTMSKRLQGVRTQPLLVDMAEIDLISGKVNLNADLTTRGNSINALIGRSDGEANFNIDEGALEGFNMTEMACRGISMAHGESLASNDWEERTPFNAMRAQILIEQGVLNNTDLTADLAGLRLEGDGTVDISSLDMAYRLGLRVVGDIHRDRACRVNERVQNIVIPVRCSGNLTDDPAGLCGFDARRFSEVLSSMGRAELDRQRQRLEQEAREASDKLRGEAEERARQERDRAEEEGRERIEQEGRRLLDRLR